MAVLCRILWKNPALLVVILEETIALGIRDFSAFMSCFSVSVLQLLKHTREVLPVCAVTSLELWAGFDGRIKFLYVTFISVSLRQRGIKSCLFARGGGVILMACSPGAMPQLCSSGSLGGWCSLGPSSAEMSLCQPQLLWSSGPLTDQPAGVQQSFLLSI